jgi:cell division GTPase FtsZ
MGGGTPNYFNFSNGIIITGLCRDGGGEKMKLCVVGIGGCGGKVAEEFLQNMDIAIMKKSLGEHVSLGGVKGLWIEADVQETDSQNFFRSLNAGYYPGFFIPHDVIGSGSKTSQYINDVYGYDLKSQGFVREAQYLKAIFEIFETDHQLQEAAMSEYNGDANPILNGTWASIRRYTTLSDIKEGEDNSEQCDGILFAVSLGGGTGTGFINPVTKYIRAERGAYAVFVLAVLTEKGDDLQQRALEAKRDMGAAISLYDLVTKRSGQGVDAAILIDNQILMDKFGRDFAAIDRYIYQAMKPMVAGRHYPGEDPPSAAFRKKTMEGLDRPPILVPCYHREKISKDLKSLVKGALNEGRLFGCEPRKAEKAYVFTRGFIDLNDLVGEISSQTGLSSNLIEPWRKLGDNRWNEVLIILRNPYGTPGAHEIEGTLEKRVYDLIEMGLKYMNEHESDIIPKEPEITRKALKNYFYGEQGIKQKFEEAKSRIQRGAKPLFRDEVKIFETERRATEDVAEGEVVLRLEGLIRKISREEAEAVMRKGMA